MWMILGGLVAAVCLLFGFILILLLCSHVICIDVIIQFYWCNQYTTIISNGLKQRLLYQFHSLSILIESSVIIIDWFG